MQQVLPRNSIDRGYSKVAREKGERAAASLMKVGIVGVGHVGGEAALNMALRDSCRELVLIDADDQLAVSQALDISQTSALVSGPRVRAGDYQDLVGAEVVVLAPGINEKAGDYLNVAPECVSALVLGEHGLSSVLLWSKVTIGGVSLESYFAGRGIEERGFRRSVEEYVKQGNINVIKGKGASEFAIGTVIARVVEIILRDECMVIPVSAYSQKYEVTLSLPRRVGRRGVLNEFEIELNKEEQEGIGNSVEALKVAMKRLDRSQ